MRCRAVWIQQNLNDSNTYDSFTMANSNSFLSPSLGNSSDSSRKQIFRSLLGSFPICQVYVCCVFSLESPHWGDSNEYTQHTILYRRSKRHPYIIPICLLIWRYYLHTVARTTHIWNKFPWSQRCSNQWSSTIFRSLAIQNAPREDSGQVARIRRLIWIFARRTCPIRYLTLRLI